MTTSAWKRQNILSHKSGLKAKPHKVDKIYLQVYLKVDKIYLQVYFATLEFDGALVLWDSAAGYQ